jgi:hypothetical protein
MRAIGRRDFITLLGGAAAWPLMARAQQGDRVRRVGVLQAGDENDSEVKRRLAAFTQALAGLGWTDGRNGGWTFGGPVVTSIEYERSRRSWSACNPTSSWQAGPPRL